MSYKMMVDFFKLVLIGLCSANGNFAKKLPRIGRYNLRIKMGCQVNGNISFAHRSRTGNHNKMFRGIYQRSGKSLENQIIDVLHFTTQAQWYSFRQFLPRAHHPESFCLIHPTWRLRQDLQEKRGNQEQL
jgi:hypothetical protein